jgi:hypothetical protein
LPRLWCSVLVSILTLAGALAAPAWATPPDESHCLVRVVDQTDDGEFIVGPEECFATFAAAQVAVRTSPLKVPRDAGFDETAHHESGRLLLSFTLGTHYDGSGGSGSSISVVGDACTGGWWNTGGAWANRISSSWNGCYRLRHYDNPDKFGSWADTVGVGSVHNLPAGMNNKTESVAYLGS